MIAFKATYSDFKLVKTRKVAQFIFEVPVEAVDGALAVVGGMPNGGDERWFGIAPLDPKLEEKQEKKRKDWRDLPPSQQAAMRCNEPTFAAFLREQHSESFAGDVPQTVRDLCMVKSRSDLNTTHSSRVLWHQLDSQYLAWKAVEHV